MIERMQFDMEIEARRFQDMIAQGVSREVRETYAEQQIKTDIGERLDRSKSHYVYEIRDGKMYGQGIDEPFTDIINRGIIQRWDGSRENSELAGYRFIQDFMTDPATPNGAMVFNPSPPDGENYQKNFLDVWKKVDNQVHTNRYLSGLTNEQYRQKIIQMDPFYEDVIPQNPKDVDFFLNPVVVPSHLDFNPDQLAKFILGDKKGMDEAEFQGIWNEANLVSLKLSVINTLVDNPWAILNLQTEQKALHAGVWQEVNGGYKPTYNFPKMEIQYLSEQKETLGGGGCGGGACSVYEPEVPKSKLDNIDGQGPLSFRCPDCKKINTRSPFQLITNCAHCESDKVLPSSVKIS